MTNAPFCPPNYLGVGPHGQYRNAAAQAQSNAYQAQAGSYLGGAAALAQQYAALAYPDIPRPTITDAGIRAGEIIGHRAWMYRRGLLWSMATSYCWVPGEIATGDVRSHMGVHAFKSLGQAVGQYAFTSSFDSVVFGTIAMWGEVIEHEMGWRAEYATIESVTLLGTPDPQPSRWKFWRKPRDTLATIQRTYGLTGETA